MPEKSEKGKKPAGSGAAPATQPDAAVADGALKERIAAARARVNELLAAQKRPLLRDGPPAAGNGAAAHEAKELSALEFLENMADPEAYSLYEPEAAAGLMAAGTRAGLKLVAEARGEPEPDFTAEKRETKSVARSAAGPASSPEAEKARDRLWDEGRWAFAEKNGGLVPLTDEDRPIGGWRQPCLPDPAVSPLRHSARAVPAAVPGPDGTERELNGLIADCRLLLREVAFHSARLACEAGDRVRFIEAGCRVAETGAKLGEAVAHLRSGQAGGSLEERKQRIVFEYAHSRPAMDTAEGSPSP